MGLGVMRYFAAMPQVYEAARLAIDEAWGLPAHGQRTCFTPAAEASDIAGDGRVLLAVDSQFCEYEFVAEMLPQLLASGQVAELTHGQWQSLMPPSPY
jgi:hypothetical protein